jgi:DNA-binding beta-propeller fold protein YncE
MRRRNFLAGSVLGVAACSRREPPYDGQAWVAARGSGRVVVVDLGAFAVRQRIALEGHPTQLWTHPSSPYVYALCADSGVFHELDARGMSIKRTLKADASQMAVLGRGQQIWFLSRDRRRIRCVESSTLREVGAISLPTECTNLSLSFYTPHLLTSVPERGEVLLADRSRFQLQHTVKTADSVGPVSFLSNGSAVLAGNPQEKQLTVIDTATGKLVVRMPLAIAPERFCFKQDGGQLFLTGAGMDAVVVVYPYQYQVAATLLAGDHPGAMATSADPEFLFVGNMRAGTVTVFSIQTQKVVGVVATLSEPTVLTVTPDNRFALAIGRQSGDMAVIRLDALERRKGKSAPLLTILPVGSEPVDAVVRV